MKLKKLAAFLLTFMLVVTTTFAFSFSAWADVTDGYKVYKSTNTSTPETTVSTLSDAFNYINSNASSDEWIIKTTGNDSNMGSTAATLNASGTTVTLTSDSGIHTLYQTNALIRHINITAGNLILQDIILDGSSLGGGISMGSSATITMNSNATIQNCKASQGGGIFCNGNGTLTLNNGSTISSCQSTFVGAGGSGAGVYSQGNVILNNGSKITGNTANGGKGGGIAICTSTATLTMNSGEISNNQVTGATADYFTGGGIVVYGGATFVMRNGKITNNKADYGAGVSVFDTSALNGSNMTMYDGEISYNETLATTNPDLHGHGGGVYVYGYLQSPFNMQGGTIKNNTGTYGGGICINDGRFAGEGYINDKLHVTIDNGNIYENTAKSGGGGIYIAGILTINNNTAVYKNTAQWGGGIYTLIGGDTYPLTLNNNTKIYENTASWGGGIYSKTALIMNDNTTIKNNSATNQGGGVFVNAPATLTMNGGTITENSAKTLGGGVSLFGKGTGFPTCKFTMNASGSPKIYNNIADEAADDVNGNGYNTEINLISVADMSLPSTVNAINWYYDIDSARYRDLSATKSVFADTLLSNITEASKLTVGITYTVNFDSKGGSNVDDITNIATDSTITKPADPTKDDYAFKGWYTDSSYTTAWDFNNDKVTDNITLYAKWDKVVTYTVNFDSKGGSDVDDITGIKLDSTITKPADPTKDGYKFKGWYTDSSCTTAWDFNNDKVTDNITLYAKWDKVVTKSEESKTPKTGDISNLMLWVILLITASGTVILIYKIKRG